MFKLNMSQLIQKKLEHLKYIKYCPLSMFENHLLNIYFPVKFQSFLYENRKLQGTIEFECIPTDSKSSWSAKIFSLIWHYVVYQT